jgi:O-antigen ligase
MLIICDALTFSRGGYLGLLVAAIFAVLFLWPRASQKNKIAVALFGIFLVASFFISNPVSNRFSSIFNFQEGSNKERISIWQYAGQVVLAHPLLGVGIGNYPLVVEPQADYRDPIYAHNTYLDIMAETGILNGIIWIGILVGAIFSFIRKSRKDIFFLAGALSLIVFSSHSLVETAIYSPVVLTLLLLILAFNLEEKRDAKNI